ncbi:VMAP-C domain-containing protein [Streptomyces fungicidicus]|uniref:VMAP-C domain-containing protein n=1 Tax=Streptomyces fungicidicus TaxID=68203 RepID=UPI0036929D08
MGERSVEKGEGFGGPDGGVPRAQGLELLSRLTGALCELSCMEDAQGRVQFAAVLGEQLVRTVDVRGVRLREDVVAMVRAALNVEGGQHVLVRVVEIFEGAAPADELDRLLAPAAPPPSPDSLPGPLSGHDTGMAHALLADVKGEVSAARLRDGLTEELNGLYLPAGLSPDQLFAHVLEWNAQPDGLPPAVLLADVAASLAASPGHRGALVKWVDGWAQRSGLTAAVARRRAARRESAVDPDIPCCLIVAVEPARDGSGEIVVRPWLNTVPGHWDPQPGEPATTTLDGLGEAVERALQQGARLWSAPDAPDRTGREQPAYVEFVLPYDLLNHDVAGLRFRIGHGRPLPLGLKYGVHLRSLERMRTDDAVVRQQWRDRWHSLRRHGVTVHGWTGADAQRLDAWQTALAGEAGRTAVVLDAPADTPALEALKAAIAEGISLAIWDRRGAFIEERREVVTAVFASVPIAAQIPMAIHRLRKKAVDPAQSPDLLGRHIAFFWDDPTRLVDIHTDDGDPADEEALA